MARSSLRMVSFESALIPITAELGSTPIPP
jgi:hypothetical protein